MRKIGLLLLVAVLVLAFSCSSDPKKISVTLYSNYDGGQTKTEQTDSATVYTPSWTPARTGYTFSGWYYDKDCTKAYSSTVLTANTELFAKWQKEPAFVDITVKCDLSQMTISETDFIYCTVNYKNGSYSGSEKKYRSMEDGEKSATFSYEIREGSGSIVAEVWHDGVTIGKGSLVIVEPYYEGAIYDVVVKHVN